MAANYAQHTSTRQTPQSDPMPGSPQVANSAGGFSFEVDCWKRLERFLVMGAEGGTYYIGEKELTQENAAAVTECYLADPERTIQTIVDISDAGRAVKNEPAIFALAMLSKDKRALEAMPKVCRTATHLFMFVGQALQFRGWGRALKTAVREWYGALSTRKLCYQLAKYQQRDGWSHGDLLRLAKIRVNRDSLESVAFAWATGKPLLIDHLNPELEPIFAFEKAKLAKNHNEIVELILNHGLVRECIPTHFLNDASVWDALLERMPIGAMIRNLGKMTNVGLLKPMSQASIKVCQRLGDVELLKKGRIHPFNILVAQRTYASGRGMRGGLTWDQNQQVVDALNDAFYVAFDAVEPTGKRWFVGCDVSGSMYTSIAGLPLTAAEATGALAMVTARTEQHHLITAFSNSGGGWGPGIQVADISSCSRLDDVLSKFNSYPFGGTDCALPMLYALEKGIEADVFCVLTDSETWAGDIHPAQALQRYREQTGIPAKLICVAMATNRYSVADPRDAGMLDVVGLDTNSPAVMADFVRY